MPEAVAPAEAEIETRRGADDFATTGDRSDAGSAGTPSLVEEGRSGTTSSVRQTWPISSTIPPAVNFVSELRAEALPTRAIPALSSGLVSGVYMVIYVFSAGGIIFSGALAPFFSQGTGTVLFGTFVVCLVITLTSGYRGAISALPSPAIVVLVAIGSTIALQGDVLFMTMVATMMVSALAGGTCFLTIGRFRLANLIRFIPFSVAGGFLAGTGGALCLAALSLMEVTPEWPMLPSLLEPSALWSWVPGGRLRPRPLHCHETLEQPPALAGELRVRRRALSSGSGVPRHFRERRQSDGDGLLFESIAEGGLWPAFEPGDLARVDWVAVAIQIPNMVALVLVVLLSVVMYLSGLELAANVELEWNREFKAAGLGSLVAGPGRQSARLPVDFRFDHQPQARGRIAADRCCRQPCHGLRADLG